MKPLSAITLIFFILFSACRNENNSVVQTITLENPYIHSYASGILSTESEIQIIFSSTNIEGANVGEVLGEEVFSFNPQIKGKTYWRNKNTLVFEPSENLPPATKYSATLQIDKIIKDAKAPYNQFSFAFNTREQHISLKLGGLISEELNNPDKISVFGQIQTEDLVSQEELKSCMKAFLNGKIIEIEWDSKSKMRNHGFSVPNIQKQGNQQILKIQVSGKSIQAAEKFEVTQIIPSLGIFEVTQIQKSNDKDEGIRIEFSEPLDANQDLEGFLEIDQNIGSLPYLIDKNAIRIYPDENLTGNLVLTIQKGIKSVSGNKLKKQQKLPFIINPSFPGVILVSQGAIVPNSKGIFFPFKAIGLSAVDVEIFKVGSQNIISLLKDNDLNEIGYQMYRMGKIIKQKTIALHHDNPLEDGMEWKKYFIDLNDLIKADPGAIYQIRIGFRQEYAINPCGNQENDLKIVKNTDYFKNSLGEQSSILDKFYGGIVHYSQFNWENRDNPCFAEYYHSDRFVSGNLFVSNMGITAKMGTNDKIWVSLSDLTNTEPLTDVQIEIYDELNELITSKKTDNSGESLIDLGGKKPAVIVSTKGKNKGYLRLNEEDALNLSRFDVSGEQVKGDIRGYLYAERNIWRPGDRLFFNFMLLDKFSILPKEYPLTMEVFDAKGQLYEKRITNDQLNGIYPLPIQTNKDDVTGTWRINIKAGGNSFEKTFKIESIQPNRLKSSLIFDNTVLKRDQEPFTAKIQAHWLHGVASSGLKAIVELKLKDENTFFPNFPSFKFENQFYKGNLKETRIVFNGNLDDLGEKNFPVTISENPDVSGFLTATFQTRIFEPSGEFSTTIEKFKYEPFNSYVGVEIPLNKWNEPVLPENKSSLIRFAVVNNKGIPQVNKKIRVSLFKAEWFWWWEADQYKNADFNTEIAKQASKELYLTTDSKGIANWNLNLKDWGRYLLVAEDLSSGHRSAQYIHSGYPDGVNDSNEKNILSLMPIKMDKNKYTPGEIGFLTFPGSAEGTAIITIENGSKILKTYRVKTKKGNNQIEIPIVEEMAPNVYAFVSFIQSYESVKNDLPIRLFGICPIYVENSNTLLNPKIITSASFKPNEKINISVSEEKGKEMTYTLAVVDEGLLGITRFKTPNPYQSFYSKEGLGIRTWDIYNKVLGSFGTEMRNLLAVGGDEGYQPDALNNSGTQFSPVVFNLGPFELKKGQRVNHQIMLPNYMGAVRIMVVARHKNSFGSTEKTVPVKNPIMLFASAPKTLSPGDQFVLPVNVFSSEKNISKISISSIDEAGLVTTTKREYEINMGGKSELLVKIPYNTSLKTGVAKIKIKVTSALGSAHQVIEIPIRNPNPITYQFKSYVLNPGEKWKQKVESFGQNGTRKMILETSSLPNIGLQNRLSYLLTYPYGCLEQTISTAFAQLYLDKFVELTQIEEKQRKKYIQSAIHQISKFQLPSGGFSYWPGNFQYDEWVTSYAGQFLIEAKEAGYLVPASLLGKWEKFQVKITKSIHLNAIWSSGEINQLNHAYRLYTLALAGKPEKGSMNQLREIGNLYTSSANRLAAAYALSGNKEIGLKLLSKTHKKNSTQGLDESFGSDIRERAQLLETFIYLDKKLKAASLAIELGKELGSNTWFSTQTTAYSLFALSKYLGNQKSGVPSNFSYLSKETNGKWVNRQHSQTIGFTSFKDFSGSQRIEIVNKGKSKLFLQLIQSGQQALGEVTPRSSGITMDITFFNLEGQRIDENQIIQGEDFKAEITVKHKGDYPYNFNDLALCQVFPSGWEIINERITDFNNPSFTEYDYLDIKDDRTTYFLDLNEKSTKKFTVRLNATYSGRFYFPAASINEMYHDYIYANTSGKWVNVMERKNRSNE